MPNAGPFSMHFSAERLADFCRQLRARARGPADSLQQLTVLQTFIGLATDDPGQPGYLHARAVLTEQLDELRESVLAQHAEELRTAVERQDAEAIARGFRSLSRSGFDAAAVRAWRAIDPLRRDASRDWIARRFQDMHQRATAASRYPDAPDLRAAGIALETYLALKTLWDTVRGED